MCERYSLTTSDQIALRFDITEGERNEVRRLTSAYNIAPLRSYLSSASDPKDVSYGRCRGASAPHNRPAPRLDQRRSMDSLQNKHG